MYKYYSNHIDRCLVYKCVNTCIYILAQILVCTRCLVYLLNVVLSNMYAKDKHTPIVEIQIATSLVMLGPESPLAGGCLRPVSGHGRGHDRLQQHFIAWLSSKHWPMITITTDTYTHKHSCMHSLTHARTHHTLKYTPHPWPCAHFRAPTSSAARTHRCRQSFFRNQGSQSRRVSSAWLAAAFGPSSPLPAPCHFSWGVVRASSGFC